MSEEDENESMQPPQNYRSPALDRLAGAPRQKSPARLIAQPPAEPAPAEDVRLAALAARLATVEQHQIDLATNLIDANLAFRRLAERLSLIATHLGRLEARE